MALLMRLFEAIVDANHWALTRDARAIDFRIVNRQTRVVNLTERIPDLSLAFGEKGRGFLSKCVATLTQTLPVEEIWLFGSCARGEITPDSDLDLLVVLEDGHGLARPNLAAFKAVAGIRNHPPLDVLAIAKSRWTYEQAHPFGLYGEIAIHGTKVYDRQSARSTGVV